MKRAILLISHGSFAPQAKAEVMALTRKLKQKTKIPIFEYSFLEINKPTILSGLETCVKKGATEIRILLNFLNSGNHTLRDIPRFIKKAQKKFPNVRFILTQPIGQHIKIPNLFLDTLRMSYKYR